MSRSLGSWNFTHWHYWCFLDSPSSGFRVWLGLVGERKCILVWIKTSDADNSHLWKILLGFKYEWLTPTSSKNRGNVRYIREITHTYKPSYFGQICGVKVSWIMDFLPIDTFGDPRTPQQVVSEPDSSYCSGANCSLVADKHPPESPVCWKFLLQMMIHMLQLNASTAHQNQQLCWLHILFNHIS